MTDEDGGIPATAEFAEYPRPKFVGDPDRLEALAKGYFQLQWIFAGSLVWFYLGSNAIGWIQPGRPDGFFVMFIVLEFAFAVFSAILVSLITYRPVKKIAFGMDWSNLTAVLVCLALGSSMFCVGIAAYVILAIIVANAILRHGVKRRFFGGFKSEDVRLAVLALRSSM